MLCPPSHRLLLRIGLQRTTNREEQEGSRRWLPLPADSRAFPPTTCIFLPIKDSHGIHPDHKGGEATGKAQIRGNSTVRIQELVRKTSTNILQKDTNNLSHHYKDHQTTSSPIPDPADV